MDPQLTVVCDESQYKRRERHDSVETLTAHWRLSSRTRHHGPDSVVMSDQEPVEQGDINFIFDTIELWRMIDVRAPASPHDPARIRLKATFAARAWLTPPISGCS